MLGDWITKNDSNHAKHLIDDLRLIRTQNVGPKTFLHLIEVFGSSSEALENIEELSIRGGKTKPLKPPTVQSACKEIEELHKYGGGIITYQDKNYPKYLLQISDFPPVLTYRGNINLLNEKNILAIVGSRNASLNSRSFTRTLVRDLVAQDINTVSGLALGIDTIVHEASLKNTIAVLAGGVDHIYPHENTKLFHNILVNSLIISEMPLGSKPIAQHFPQRNRIIAGMSSGTVVIEAGIKSGSIITANFALNYNREVFAVPGFPLDPRCRGTNKLIKDGAYLIESANDIIDVINRLYYKQNILKEEIDITKENKYNIPQVRMSDIDNERKKIRNMLSSTPVTYEQIQNESNIPLNVIYTICLELEVAGKLIRHPGNKISVKY